MQRRLAAAAQDAQDEAELGVKQNVAETARLQPCNKMPIVGTGVGHWRMHGFFEHQVWSTGVRLLDQERSTEGLYELRRRPDASSAFFRGRLMRDLLAEEIQLKSIPPSDVSAAQGDLSLLSLRQLLRLRALHIGVAPGGGSVDSINAVGDSHAAFIAKLDGLLLEQLGREALRELNGKYDDSGAADLKFKRFGHVLLLTYAVAQSLPSMWWACHLGGLRLFFDPEAFVCCSTFPAGVDGVLQVRDLSVTHGRLLRLDWHIDVVQSEAELANAKEVSTPMQPSVSVEALHACLAALRKTGHSCKEGIEKCTSPSFNASRFGGA